MVSLDSISLIKKTDKYDMAGIIESFAQQCKDAANIGSRFIPPACLKKNFKNIVATGMGGSSIGEDVARTYTLGEIKIPFIVNRNYSLPSFVDKYTLVVVSSYSGNTEETLSAYADAREKGAEILVITSGGRLRDLAERDGAGLIIIPVGYPPRCALGYSLIPLTIALSKLGLIADKTDDIKTAIRTIENMNKNLGIDIPEKKNIAKQLARKLYGRYPVIYGSQNFIDAVVTRWKGQFAENSKTLSSGNVIPEMNHNEILGWSYPKKLIKNCVCIFLKDKNDNARILKRMDIVKRILKRSSVESIDVHSVGNNTLSKILSLVYIGDYVSFYLSILNGVDPTPVEIITYLKKELSKS